jgi:hypothetical protein
MSQEPAPCTRCQVNPRVPGQRWCRACLTASQKQRRAAQCAAVEEDTPTPVTHAETQELPGVTHVSQALQDPTPVSAAPPSLTLPVDPQALQQVLAIQLQAFLAPFKAAALTAYMHAKEEYDRAEQEHGKWNRLRVIEPWNRLEAARQLCQKLGVNPDAAQE